MRLIAWLAWGVVWLGGVGGWGEELPPWASEQGKVSARDLEVTEVPPAPEMLTLEEALKLGYANNADFRSAIASLLNAQSDLRVALQLYSWTASGSAEVSDAGADGSLSRTSLETDLDYDLLSGGTVSISALLDRLDSQQSSALGLSVTQPLIRGAGRASARYERVRSAYTAYRSALLRYWLRRQELAVDIIRGYFGVVRAQEQVDIQQRGLRQADMAVEYAEARLREGLTTRIEVARARLSQASRGLALARARQAYQTSMDAFLQTLGLKVGAMPRLTTRVAYKPVALDAEALVAEALGKRAELKIQELALEDTKAALRITRNRSRPSLDLFGSTVEPLSGGNGGTEWTLGIRTSIPINSRALREAVREAERAWLVAQRDYAELRQSVAAQVRREVHALRSQQATLDIVRQSLEVAREKLRLAVISVEEGVGVDRDKIEAQDEVTDAERDLVDAQIEYYFGVIALRKAVGRDVLEGLSEETVLLESPGEPAESPQPRPGEAGEK